MLETYHLSMTELEAGMETLRQAPKDEGTLKMIVRRPSVDERETVNEGELRITDGLVGDNWKARGSEHTPNRSANVNAQITVMNVRATALLAQSAERWAL